MQSFLSSSEFSILSPSLPPSLFLSLFNPTEKLFGKSKPCFKHLEKGERPALPLSAVG